VARIRVLVDIGAGVARCRGPDDPLGVAAFDGDLGAAVVEVAVPDVDAFSAASGHAGSSGSMYRITCIPRAGRRETFRQVSLRRC
jgi:hypothetical protein